MVVRGEDGERRIGGDGEGKEEKEKMLALN